MTRKQKGSPRSGGKLPARPTRAETEDAIRTLIRWAGDDPAREGLLETPARVARAYEEYFAGYAQDPAEILAKTFAEVDGYDEMIVMNDIRFESHCEHHIAPIIGRAHIGYLPDRRVVGISKLARLVEVYARRLQIQEKMTVQIADTLAAGPSAQGRSRGDRSRAPVHDDARGAQARCRPGDEPNARCLP